MKNTVTFQLKNNVCELERLNQVVDEFGEKNRLAPDDLYTLHLSLDEVFTNIISYGYEDSREHLVTISIALKGEDLTVEVEDDGSPFNPLDAPKPDLEQPIEERTVGGLGIHLVRSMMDTLEYRRSHGKNILTMNKKIKYIRG